MASARKKARRRPKRKMRGSGPKALARRVRERFPQHELVVGQSRDGVRMSEVLEQFIAPYRDWADTEEALHRLLVTAIAAWNIAIFPDQEQNVQLEKFIGLLPEEVRENGREIVKEMIERKKKHFARYRRMILDYELVDEGAEYRLHVVSTLDDV